MSGPEYPAGFDPILASAEEIQQQLQKKLNVTEKPIPRVFDQKHQTWDVGVNHTGMMLAARFNNTAMFCGGSSGELKIYHRQNLRDTWMVMKQHTKNIRSLDVADNLVIAGSADRSCSLWNWTTNTQMRVFENHSDEVNCCTIHPGFGTAISSGDDKFTHLYDCRTFEKTNSIKVHTAAVYWHHYDGAILTTCSTDTTTAVFDVRKLSSPMTKLQCDRAVRKVWFDDRDIICANQGHVLVFDRRTFESKQDVVLVDDAAPWGLWCNPTTIAVSQKTSVVFVDRATHKVYNKVNEHDKDIYHLWLGGNAMITAGFDAKVRYYHFG
eukprot:TRINITY_DN6280_c0_g1_i1.p1 TRINITY_DN6280_c0_g1~~TRINITY_DN6280_c0_g1_i1.p1  ORF type:complete len:324 (+),score=41.28 TRINITY_DN6280_c0_g1_i1:54-1025(+)